MGQYLSTPVTDKDTLEGSGNGLKYSVSSMQGWRISMEDAHIAAVSYPELIVPIFLENYRRFTSGQDLLHVIDFEQGY